MIARLLNRLAGVAGGLAYPIAGLVALTAPQPAFASDWGCQVILCLATPGSPTTYAACVPPITKLWNVLALGGSFPSCTGVGIRTKKVKHGYDLTVTQSDGSSSSYALDTRTQTVTQQ
ncbi:MULTISPECIES: hypothetical protein [unclassified Sphingomonas]|uniref:hypothetical protein n=1 Tax=unclassified Sphingomonas TaxID=196159 RepID=UPI0006F4166D|nr:MULTISPECIES: hypothetical protein [unclassified Sphingomonas]KRB78795.1 hypothetical protein ASE00_21445 [Sphingomonas sp. Root710]KRB93705.1 hypothetical protein ASE22_25215 [Sphingomonas sp. Root720]